MNTDIGDSAIVGRRRCRAGTVQCVSGEPIATGRGKVLPFRRMRHEGR